MQNTRQQKIERLIQKDMSDILLRYARSLYSRFHGVLVSVSEVRVSPDLAIAHIYLSIYPESQEKPVMEQIEHDTPRLRGELGTLERHQLRVIPELHFHLDDTIGRLEHIDELLRSDN